MALQTQQRVSTASVSSASLFLPTQQQATSLTSPLARRHARSQQSVQHRMKSHTGTSTYSKQKENELETQTGNRLTVLHSRLQQEAEKIRKWKNMTELELKHKEKCLEEAKSTIGSQQKSLTDLQLKNEALQSKLNDEITNQKEINKKLASTREMCTALKDHCLKINALISKGEEDRDQLMHLNQQRLAEYQDLLGKYRQFEKDQQDWREKYKEALANERTATEEAEKRHRKKCLELEETQKKVLILEEQSSKDNQTIENLTVEVKRKTLECSLLTKDKDELTSVLSAKMSDIARLEENVKQLLQELASTKKNLDACKQELHEANNTITRNKSSHSEEVSKLTDSLASITADCKKLEDTNANLKTELAKMNAHFGEKCQAFAKELEEKQKVLSYSGEVGQRLKEDLSTANRKCSELESVNSQLKSCQQKLEEELTTARGKLSEEMIESKKSSAKAKELMSEVVSRHERADKCWKEKEEYLEGQVETVRKEKDQLASDLRLLRLELEDLKTTLEIEKAESSRELSENEESIQGLRSEIDKLNKVKNSLEEKVETLTKNKETLTVQCSDKEKIEAQNACLTTSLSAKTSENEQLQEKVALLQSETVAKDRELKLLMEKLNDTLSAAMLKEDTTRKAHEQEVAALKEEMAAKKSELMELLGKSKEETEKAERELEKEKKECAREVQDLVAAFDSYRSEHENTITKKDNIIDALRMQLQQNEREKEIGERELKVCQEKNEELQSDIETKNDELKELLRSIESMCSKTSASSSLSASNTPSSRKRRATKTTPKSTNKMTIRDRDEVTSCNKASSPPPPPTPTMTTSIPSASSSNICTPHQLQPPLNTPLHQSHPPISSSNSSSKPTVPSTPVSRTYSYCVTSLPRKITTSTPKVGRSRAKRTQYRSDAGGTEAVKHRDNISYAQEEDESVFKRPKLKDASVTVQQASSTTTPTARGTSKPKRYRGTTPKGKKAQGMKETEDLSWFDLDSVYGFGVNDL